MSILQRRRALGLLSVKGLAAGVIYADGVTLAGHSFGIVEGWSNVSAGAGVSFEDSEFTDGDGNVRKALIMTNVRGSGFSAADLTGFTGAELMRYSKICCEVSIDGVIITGGRRIALYSSLDGAGYTVGVAAEATMNHSGTRYDVPAELTIPRTLDPSAVYYLAFHQQTASGGTGTAVMRITNIRFE